MTLNPINASLSQAQTSKHFSLKKFYGLASKKGARSFVRQESKKRSEKNPRF
jgi:hypothetical protein